MKIQSKKKFIAFSLVVILVTIFSLTWIQGGRVSAATVGQILKNPEASWKRIDDSDSKIIYSGDWMTTINPIYYNSTLHYNSTTSEKIVRFKFYGTKLRIISSMYTPYGNDIKITIDGITESFTEYSTLTGQNMLLLYEKINLPQKEHTVVINNNDQGITFDAIDIDDNGYLTDATEILATDIILNKTSLSLNVGQTEDLITTVKPDNAENKKVTWTSSDESIATVDENGKVTAIKAGNATITAKTTDGSNLTTTCDVTVVQPSNDRAILAITMTNGQTKEYDLSNSEIEAFANWFDSSNGKGQLKFGFTKKIQPYKAVKEYVVFDKISSYEVRSYTVSN